MYAKMQVMKLILLLIFVLSTFIIHAQSMTLRHDTLVFAHRKFYKGKMIGLSNGTAGNQDYRWVFWGIEEPANSIGAKWSHTIICVDSIYQWRDRYYLQCSVHGLRNKFNIDIERALNYGEVKE